VTCHEVREALPAYARDQEASAGVRRHLGECASCRAELARYEALLGGLGQLHASVATPPHGLRSALMAIPHRARIVDRVAWRTAALRGHVARNRRSYVGGAVAVVGAAGAALWRARRVATA
jgi:predicted anti-sigma-YlaC factor YlaD